MLEWFKLNTLITQWWWRKILLEPLCVLVLQRYWWSVKTHLIVFSLSLSFCLTHVCAHKLILHLHCYPDFIRILSRGAAGELLKQRLEQWNGRIPKGWRKKLFTHTSATRSLERRHLRSSGGMGHHWKSPTAAGDPWDGEAFPCVQVCVHHVLAPSFISTRVSAKYTSESPAVCCMHKQADVEEHLI